MKSSSSKINLKAVQAEFERLRTRLEDISLPQPKVEGNETVIHTTITQGPGGKAIRLLDANDDPHLMVYPKPATGRLTQSTVSPTPSSLHLMVFAKGVNYSRIEEGIFRLSCSYRILHLNRKQVKCLQSLLRGCDGTDSLDYIDGSCLTKNDAITQLDFDNELAAQYLVQKVKKTVNQLVLTTSLLATATFTQVFATSITILNNSAFNYGQSGQAHIISTMARDL